VTGKRPCRILATAGEQSIDHRKRAVDTGDHEVDARILNQIRTAFGINPVLGLIAIVAVGR
jgi:hypothetical protein